VRLREAKDLLETTALRIKEIAARVGFRDNSHFVRDFETFFGISPTRYRLQFMLNLSFKKPQDSSVLNAGRAASGSSR
jgi:transcriptional regulator GlxA family with amidase domain